jgi:hypothetical protein
MNAVKAALLFEERGALFSAASLVAVTVALVIDGDFSLGLLQPVL